MGRIILAQATVPTAPVISITGEGSGVPAPALAVGYTTLAFDSTLITPAGTTVAGTMMPWNFDGETIPTSGYTQNGDGSILCTGNQASGNNFGATLCSARIDGSKPNGWGGNAFGGGFYAECTFSITGTPTGSYGNTPSFWFLDIQKQSGGYGTITHWGELDVIETDVAGLTQYGSAFHDDSASGSVNASVGSPFSPSGLNLNNSNKFAALWVPATASTQGYVQFYCNDIAQGNKQLWNQYNPSETVPVSGANIANIMDVRNWFIIVGNSLTTTPMTITAIKVYQGPGATNLVVS